MNMIIHTQVYNTQVQPLAYPGTTTPDSKVQYNSQHKSATIAQLEMEPLVKAQNQIPAEKSPCLKDAITVLEGSNDMEHYIESDRCAGSFAFMSGCITNGIYGMAES